MNKIEQDRTAQGVILNLNSNNEERSLAEFMKLPRLNRLHFTLGVLRQLQQEDTEQKYNYADIIAAVEQRINNLTPQPKNQ